MPNFWELGFRISPIGESPTPSRRSNSSVASRSVDRSMKSRNRGNDESVGVPPTSKGSVSSKKKNVKRLGGGGLSLEAFANMKPNRSHYNPAIAKKQREFYNNAKYVSKYKRTLKHHAQQNDLPVPGSSKDETESGSSAKGSRKKKKGWNSLNHLYEEKREADEKARMEREATMQAKKEEMEKAAARRKAEKGKMLKRTRSGQPLMKYRIEHLLQTIQGSS